MNLLAFAASCLPRRCRPHGIGADYHAAAPADVARHLGRHCDDAAGQRSRPRSSCGRTARRWSAPSARRWASRRSRPRSRARRLCDLVQLPGPERPDGDRDERHGGRRQVKGTISTADSRSASGSRHAPKDAGAKDRCARRSRRRNGQRRRRRPISPATGTLSVELPNMTATPDCAEAGRREADRRIHQRAVRQVPDRPAR